MVLGCDGPPDYTMLGLRRDQQPDEDPASIPNYLSDLNAMHEAEGALYPNTPNKYIDTLKEVCGAVDPENGKLSVWMIARATAAQRAEAFLRTIGKWKDAL